MSNDLQPGEKDTVHSERRFSFWDSAPEELVGKDTHIEDLQASNIRIEGKKGSGEIVFDIDAEVRGINNDELPAFQTQEQYERQQERLEELQTSASKPPKRVSEAISVGVTGVVIAISSFVAVRVLNAADMSINGATVDAPSAYSLMAAMAILFFAFWAIQYLPRMLRGGSGNV